MRTSALYPWMAAALAVYLASPAAAQVVEEPLTPHFSGTTTLRVGALNAAGDDTAALVPGVSSTSPSTDLGLYLDAKVSLPSVNRVRTADGDVESHGVGFEFGARANLGNLFTYYSGSSKTNADSTSNPTSHYSMVQTMIDWYENNKLRYGLPSNPFGAAGWPTTAYGGSSGNYQFVTGTAAERSDEVSWTDAKWAQADELYHDIYNAINGAIDHLASDVVPSGAVKQTAYQALSPEGKKKALRKQRALNAFNALTGGTSTSASLTGPQVQSAYLKVTELLGVVDTRVDFVGASLSTGALVTSPRAGQPATGALGTVSLSPGVLPGLALSAAADVVGGSPQVAENNDTQNLEYDPGDPSWIGIQAKASWTSYFEGLNGELTVTPSLLLPDAVQLPGNWAAGLATSWVSTGDVSVAAQGEVNWLRWSDRYVDGGPVSTGWGAGAKAGVDWRGVGPHVKVLWKQVGYGGTGPNATEDRFNGITAQDDFDDATAAGATLADLGLRFDPRYWIAREIVWVDVGVTKFGAGEALGAMDGRGWYAVVGYNLRDTLDLPVSGEVQAIRYTNSSGATYADSGALPDAGPGADLTWKASVRFQPLKALILAAEVVDQPPTSRRDSARLVQANFLTSIHF